MKAADIVALPMKLGSAVRQRRLFHPLGVLASGRIERVAAHGEGLPIDSADILARVSKAIGIPGGLPDLIGLAWRMPAATPAATPWDILTASAGSGLLTRFALRPTTSWTGTTLSTLMPLRHEDGWWWVKAAMTTPVDGGLSLDTVREAISEDGVVFDIHQAHGTRPFEPLAELTLTRRGSCRRSAASRRISGPVDTCCRRPKYRLVMAGRFAGSRRDHRDDRRLKVNWDRSFH